MERDNVRNELIGTTTTLERNDCVGLGICVGYQGYRKRDVQLLDFGRIEEASGSECQPDASLEEPSSSARGGESLLRPR
jgi:hypothetical protein